MAPAHRVRALRAATGMVLLLGYTDLLRGGVTIAPALLVAGYVVLVPLVLLFG